MMDIERQYAKIRNTYGDKAKQIDKNTVAVDCGSSIHIISEVNSIEIPVRRVVGRAGYNILCIVGRNKAKIINIRSLMYLDVIADDIRISGENIVILDKGNIEVFNGDLVKVCDGIIDTKGIAINSVEISGKRIKVVMNDNAKFIGELA